MGKISLTGQESPDSYPTCQLTGSSCYSRKANHCRSILSRTTRYVLIILVCALPLNLLLLDSSWAQSSSRSPAANAALGVTSLLATVPYGATKLLYAGLGALVGSFSYILTLGNTDTAEKIWEKSLLGTYVLGPEHLTGEETIHFVGP